ncbi:MAG: hypothetical protein LBS01_01730 [Prevotellaceae bacterium]|jgi:hypothetical protein|nr:hypothetical protein [Prevotellaceae bacterium]
MKQYIFTAISIMALFVSCSKSEPQMDRNIFIPDENDSQLPAYTEWGYNSFGAKIDRQYFVSTSHIMPCRALYKDGYLQFSLSGVYWLTYSGNTEMTLSFSFPCEQLHTYADLLILNEKNMELSAGDIQVVQTKVENTAQSRIETIDTLNVVSGMLHFRRAQLLSIDDQPNRAIVSGVFEFRYIEDNNVFPVSVSNGRFDIGINRDNFYAY